MNALVTGSRRAARWSLIAAAFAVAALALAQDGRTAEASGAGEIVISKSETTPTGLSSIVLIAGDEPSTFYVWIKNLEYPTGASAFQVKFTYGPDVAHVTYIYPETVWLGSTGRVVACLGAGIDNVIGEAYVACNTLQPGGPGHWGAEGTGLLATFELDPLDQVALTAVDFSEHTWMVDTPPNPDDMQQIPVKAPALNVQVSPCADYTGAPDGGPDGSVRVDDILYVVARYFTKDLTADLNDSGDVTVTDILIAVQQYFADCPA